MKISRTTEFVLGLIGGIFGILSGIVALLIGGIGGAVGASGATSVVGLAMVAMLLSILGIVGSAIVKGNAKLGGIFMTVSAIGGTICISAFYILPGILLIVAGLMALIRKDKLILNDVNE